MQKKLLLLILAIALLIGGAVLVWQKNQVVLKEATKEVVVDDASEWKMYRNDQIGIEFKYPKNTEVIYSDQKENTENGEAAATIRIKENNENRVSMNYFSSFDLEKYREHWKELDSLAQKEGQAKISLGEFDIQNDNVQMKRFDYCSYTLAGVNCDLKFSQYLVLLENNEYLLLKSDVWQNPKENQNLLSKILQSLSLL